MKQYLDLLRYVLDSGIEKQDRTGTGTISTFGYQMRFDLSKGFPLVTTKNVSFRLIVSELLWFIKGDTNIGYLHDNNNHIWDEWADSKGNLGRIYSSQWRDWHGAEEIDINHPLGIKNVRIKHVDQLKNVIQSIKTNPSSRRHIVSAWNAAEIDDMALPPCHTMFQFYVANNKLSCQLYQRSADVFLGVPFNIASYSLLTQMIAHECGLKLGEFIHTFGDAHIYKNHIDQVKLQLAREPFELPYVTLSTEVKSVFDFTMNDIELHNYRHHPTIKGEVSV